MTYLELSDMIKDCQDAAVDYMTQYPSNADDIVKQMTDAADRIYQVSMQIDDKTEAKNA